MGYSGLPLDDHASYWSAQTGMLDLGSLGGPHGSSAHDINDDGVIVGYTYKLSGRVGAVWHDSVLYDLNTLLVNGQSVAWLATPVETPMTTLISPSIGKAGEFIEIEVVEATPGAEVQVFYGTRSGVGSTGACSHQMLAIANPRQLSLRADPQGKVTARFFVPAGLQGKRLLVQAIDVSTCDRSNLIVRRRARST